MPLTDRFLRAHHLGITRSKTKLPGLPDGHITRPRLTSVLDAAEGRVTVISAPAGFGKTRLLAEWSARNPSCTAWVSVDEDDNDDRRLWSAVLASLLACPAVSEDSPLGGITVPTRPGTDPAFLALVAAALDTVEVRIRLVLDDVHELTSEGSLHGLKVLVRHRPKQLHLVLSGRGTAPLPTARLRLTGELVEIAAHELRFSEDEVTALLRSSSIALQPHVVRRLVEHSGGWPAGLQLAVDGLRTASDPHGMLDDLVCSARPLEDWLASEVVSQLSSTTLAVLRAASACDPLPADLAIELTGQPNAAGVLYELGGEQALVRDTGPEGFSVHPLLRSHLTAELRRTRPADLIRLRDRAAEWFARRGRAAAALRHAAAGSGPEHVRRLLETHGVAWCAVDGGVDVGVALRGLGHGTVDSDPWLSVLAALVALMDRRTADAEAHLIRANRRWPAQPHPELTALYRSVRHRLAARVGGGAEPVHEALHGPAPRTPSAIALLTMALLDRASATAATGRHHTASETASAALEHARVHHLGYLEARALGTLGASAAAMGDYRRATQLADLALSAGPPGSSAAWSARVLGGHCSLLRADPAACLALLGEPTTRSSDLDDLISRALRGAARVDLGDGDAALSELRAARSDIVFGGRADAVAALVAVLEFGAATQLGHHGHAGTVLAWAQQQLADTAEARTLSADRHAGLGRDRLALETLAPVLDGRAGSLLPWTVLVARVLACRVMLTATSRSRARQELMAALRLADASDVLRPLVNGPATVIDLMSHLVGSFGSLEPVVARVLGTRHALELQERPVALTGREQTVLALLCTTTSLEEIATRLDVSTSTVKTHVRGVYGKLGVHSRREAAAHGRRLGLVPALVPPPRRPTA